MIDELIASRAQKQDHNRRVALRLQRIARIVVIPAAALMISGLVWFALTGFSGNRFGEEAVIPLQAILSRKVLTPVGAMSAGLLALALLPVINVFYILVDSLLVRRWRDAVVAAVVAGILILGLVLGRA